MKQARKSLSILLITTMLFSLFVAFGNFALAAGTVIVSYDTGAAYYKGDVVELTATPSDIIGITNVEFYDGTTLLGNDTTAPYTFYYINLPLGTHSITAKVTDAASNVTTSDVVILTVSERATTKVQKAGNDFSGYSGGSYNNGGVNINTVTTATALATTSAPERPGNKCIQFVSGSTGTDAYRIAFSGMTSIFNTQYQKTEVTMDMCFADFGVDRSFLKIWGAAAASGAMSGANTSTNPIQFKTTGKITYLDSTGAYPTIKEPGTTNDLVLSLEKWYTFKYITWTDGAKRLWQFYVDGEKVLDTTVMPNSAPTDGTSNSYYYYSSSFLFGRANPVLGKTFYLDNVYMYQHSLETATTVSINNPVTGIPYTPSTPITFAATASTSDATAIQKVQYYEDGQLIGESATGPSYTLEKSFGLGDHSVVARAVAANGYSGYSSSYDFSVENLQCTVSVIAGSGGSVISNPTDATVNAGQTVEFTITPEQGYEIGDVLFDGNPVVVTNNTFTTPPLTTNVELNVSFIPRVKVAPTITIVDPFHAGQQIFNGTSPRSGKIANMTIDSSFLSYATISNPDGYTLSSFGMILKDEVSGKVIELPVLYKTNDGQFAVQVFGAGFQNGSPYSLQSYLTYTDDQSNTKLVVSELKKVFHWIQ